MITLVEIANRLKEKVEYDFDSEEQKKKWNFKLHQKDWHLGMWKILLVKMQQNRQ